MSLHHTQFDLSVVVATLLLLASLVGAVAHDYEHYRDREDGEGDDDRDHNGYRDSRRAIVFGRGNHWHGCFGTLARGGYGEVGAEKRVRRCGLDSIEL